MIGTEISKRAWNLYFRHALGRAKIFMEADVLLPDTVHTIPYVSVQYRMLQ